jgi:hypothetical protein
MATARPVLPAFAAADSSEVPLGSEVTFWPAVVLAVGTAARAAGGELARHAHEINTPTATRALARCTRAERRGRS